MSTVTQSSEGSSPFSGLVTLQIELVLPTHSELQCCFLRTWNDYLYPFYKESAVICWTSSPSHDFLRVPTSSVGRSHIPVAPILAIWENAPNASYFIGQIFLSLPLWYLNNTIWEFSWSDFSYHKKWLHPSLCWRYNFIVLGHTLIIHILCQEYVIELSPINNSSTLMSIYSRLKECHRREI